MLSPANEKNAEILRWAQDDSVCAQTGKSRRVSEKRNSALPCSIQATVILSEAKNPGNGNHGQGFPDRGFLAMGKTTSSGIIEVLPRLELPRYLLAAAPAPYPRPRQASVRGQFPSWRGRAWTRSLADRRRLSDRFPPSLCKEGFPLRPGEPRCPTLGRPCDAGSPQYRDWWNRFPPPALNTESATGPGDARLKDQSRANRQVRNARDRL